MIRKIAIALVVVLAVLAGAGYAGLHYYRVSQLKDQLNSAMGKDAAYAETVLKIEQDSSNITYAELYKLCDEAVDGRQKLIIDLRGAYPGLNDAIKEQLIEFLNKENDFVRAKSRMYRNTMEFSSAYEDYLKYVSGDLPSYE